MLNDRQHKIIKMHENAWSLSYLYPDLYGGAKIPEEHPIASNTTTLTMDRTVKSYNGTYLGVFSPVVETCAPYFNASTTGILPTGNLSDYIVYADNNGAALNTGTDGILNSLSTWNYKQGPTINRLGAYKKLRIVGACMEITVRDRIGNYAGIIETCSGYEVIGNGFKNDSVDINKLQNHVHYRNYKTNEHVVVKYKYTNEKYTKYGPYDPFTSVPFYLVKITGMSSTASVNVKTTIHIEGALMPSLVHFTTKDLIPQASFGQQRKKMESDGTTSTTKEESIKNHNNETQNLSETVDYETYTPVTTKKKKQKIEPEVLKKRESPEQNLDLPVSEPQLSTPGGLFSSGTTIVRDIFGSMKPSEFVDILRASKPTQMSPITNGEIPMAKNQFALPPSDGSLSKQRTSKRANIGTGSLTITNGEVAESKTPNDNAMNKTKMTNEFSAKPNGGKKSDKNKTTPEQFVEAFRLKVKLTDQQADYLKGMTSDDLQILYRVYKDNPKKMVAYFTDDAKTERIRPDNRYEVPVDGDL